MIPSCKQHAMWVETEGSLQGQQRINCVFPIDSVDLCSLRSETFRDNNHISGYMGFPLIHLHYSESWQPVVSTFVVAAELVCSSLLSSDKSIQTLLGHPRLQSKPLQSMNGFVVGH